MHRRQRWTPKPAAQSLGPFGSEFRPRTPDQLFVSNAHNAASAPARSRRPRTQPPAYCRRGSPGSPPADRPVLGGDHPARPVPVHREHRIRHHLPLRDRPWRHPDAAGQHTGRRHQRPRIRWSRSPGCPDTRPRAIRDVAGIAYSTAEGTQAARSGPGSGRPSRQACRQLPHWPHHQRVKPRRHGNRARRLRTHVRPGRDGPLNTRGAVPGTPLPDRQGD